MRLGLSADLFQINDVFDGALKKEIVIFVVLFLLINMLIFE